MFVPGGFSLNTDSILNDCEWLLNDCEAIKWAVCSSSHLHLSTI